MKREAVYRIFSNIPTLETPRLILRRMKVSDSADMYEYARRHEVTAYLSWSPHPNQDYTRDYLEYVGTHYAMGDFYDWAVIYKENGKMIGTCGFTKLHFLNNCGEVGYVLNPAYWGQEIALEALRAVIRFGFENLQLHRIEAKFIRGNAASLRVMEKAGMTFEGVQRESMLIKNEYRDIGVCSILRDECLTQEKTRSAE